MMCYSNGFVDIWSTPKAAVNITYTYHPIPPSGRDTDEFSGTPDGEETILIPVLVAQRPLRPRIHCRESGVYPGLKEFDPTTMHPDSIDVKINIGVSVCYAYGSLVCNFLSLKVMYFCHFTVQFLSGTYVLCLILQHDVCHFFMCVSCMYN